MDPTQFFAASRLIIVAGKGGVGKTTASAALSVAAAKCGLSVLLVALMLAAAWQGALHDSLWFGEVRFAGFTLHPLVLVFAVSGSLMVSRIRFPKF